MLDQLYHFFTMNGYGAYIWLAYGIVILALGAQWLIPHKRWKKYLKKNHHE